MYIVTAADFFSKPTTRTSTERAASHAPFVQDRHSFSVAGPPDEAGISWNDPALGVSWPIDQPTLSVRDSQNPPLASTMDLLPVWGEALR